MCVCMEACIGECVCVRVQGCRGVCVCVRVEACIEECVECVRVWMEGRIDLGIHRHIDT